MKLIHDENFCIGCRSCQQACQDCHDLPPQLRLLTIRESEQTPPLAVRYRLDACRQCSPAPCASRCPKGAIAPLPTGALQVDPARCIGCGACRRACPFGAIVLTHSPPIAQKCDLCPDRTVPVCVAACPMGCLRLE